MLREEIFQLGLVAFSILLMLYANISAIFHLVKISRIKKDVEKRRALSSQRKLFTQKLKKLELQLEREKERSSQLDTYCRKLREDLKKTKEKS